MESAGIRVEDLWRRDPRTIMATALVKSRHRAALLEVLYLNFNQTAARVRNDRKASFS